MKFYFLLLFILTIFSCTHKNSEEETNIYYKLFKKDVFDYTGIYTWSFDLMGGKQVSKHTFYKDSITYKMKGKVYSTNYTMKKLSYDKDKNKWIGEDEDGIIYVLFFKNITDSSIAIYKRKCKTNGLKEALDFDFPESNSTEDHGWNIYAIDDLKIDDLLPIYGHFYNSLNSIFISDSTIHINKKIAKKMSFHSGERRWVGQYDKKYIQIFFNSLKIEDSLKLSINWSNNLKELYKAKYNSVKNWENYARE